MSLPPLIPEGSATSAEWMRKVRDAVNGLLRRTSDGGTTAERPTKAATGQQFYDETLGKPIWRHVSGVWKDASGATV